MDLRLDDAVPLAAALTFFECRRLGIPAILLKGTPAADLGVRPPKVPGDVDVLLKAPDASLLARALHRRGWLERPVTHAGDHPIHSATLYHPSWPSDIDIHFAYPGMDDQPTAAFEALWEHRREVQLGGVPVEALDLAGSTLVQALHALRELHKGTNQRELTFLLEQAPKPAWAELERLAARTGSLGALRPYIARAFPDVDPTALPEPSGQWRSRAGITAPGVHRMLYLRRLPWRQRPAYLWRALVPSREMLASLDLRLLEADRTTLWAARLRRLRLFVRSATRSFREWLKFRPH
ncbi:nucleotidyltransferase family protein [Zhihengliuella sp.]|uniref:nucleotidyltransferase family protein n=1 Tax=Zhihengliuella sp. TaxID=1954483 RepID=UPI00281155C2|nr:nucleotidyltransferase family protein [Zhihengliuella sp.]